MREALQPILDKVWRHCEVYGTRGRTVTLKVKSPASRSSSAAAPRPSSPMAATLQAVNLALLGVALSSLTITVAGRPQMALGV